MKQTEWEEFFSKVKYKPNFTLEYTYLIDFDQEKLTITMRVPDSRDPRNWDEPPSVSAIYGPEDPRRIPLVPVTASFMLEFWHGERYAKDWLRSVLRQLEDHELDEWFRYEGELVNDPHEGEIRRAG